MKGGWIFFLLLTVLPLVAADPSLLGRSEADIVGQFGRPQSIMDLGETKVLGYPGMLLEFKNGKVVKKSAPPAPVKTVEPVAAPKSPEAAKTASEPTDSAQEGETLELSFTALDGQAINLKDFEGKVVVIDFWATWCGPCVGEIPHLLAAYQKYHTKGLEVIGISLDHDKDKLLAFLQQNAMTWPQYFDGKGWNNAISKSYGINSIPRLWLIDKKGRLASKDVRRTLEAAIEKALAE